MRNKHRKNKGFTDAEIMDDSFPNPHMSIKNHREARHKYYRDKTTKEKNKNAVQLYKKGWVGILWDIFNK
jgi:hypothetical protein